MEYGDTFLEQRRCPCEVALLTRAITKQVERDGDAVPVIQFLVQSQALIKQSYSLWVIGSTIEEQRPVLHERQSDPRCSADCPEERQRLLVHRILLLAIPPKTI